MAGILSQQFKDCKLHPVSFISRKHSSAKLNYDVFDEEMLAIVFLVRIWRHFLQLAEHKTIVNSDHQNSTYFKTTVPLNIRQARRAEELQTFNFDLFYRKGFSILKADSLSRCLAFTCSVGGTTAAGNQTFLWNEQWLEIRAMQIKVNKIDVINIGAMDVKQLSPEAKEHIKKKALLDQDYQTICKQHSSE
jgi:hypothetical protein